MKILLAGASGLVGGRLSDYLAKKNLKVINVSRKKKVNFLKINWNSQGNINNLCRNIDIIINCSGLDIYGSKNKKLTYKANSKNPLKLLKAANLNYVKYFFHLSTYAIYKKNNSNIIDEKTKTAGHDLHTLSKISGENNLINYSSKKTKLCIIRSCNLFGYPKYKNKNCWRLLINYLIQNSITRKSLNINAKKNYYRTYSSIESFCDFFFKLLKFLTKKKKFPTVINYTSNKVYSIKSIINIIIKKLIKKKIFNEKIIFKKKIEEDKKIIFKSLYQSKIKKISDKFFDKEISALIDYCKKNIS